MTCRTPDHIYDLFIHFLVPFAFLLWFLFLLFTHILQRFSLFFKVTWSYPSTKQLTIANSEKSYGPRTRFLAQLQAIPLTPEGG